MGSFRRRDLLAGPGATQVVLADRHRVLGGCLAGGARVTAAAKDQGYRTAGELLAQQTSPEELQRRLWALEEQVARHQRWLQAHEASLAHVRGGDR